MKRKQTNQFLDELIEESIAAGGTLFGGAGAGGAGTFSYAQQAGAKTWAPKSPERRVSTSDPEGYNVKDIGDEEHMFKHQAPKKMPFPLGTINDYIVDAYLQLCNVESQLKACEKYNALITTNKEKKVLISHLRKKTKAIKKMLENISEDLDKIAFS